MTQKPQKHSRLRSREAAASQRRAGLRISAWTLAHAQPHAGHHFNNVSWDLRLQSSHGGARLPRADESKAGGTLTLWWKKRLSGTCKQLCPHCALLLVWGCVPLCCTKVTTKLKATQQLPGTAKAPRAQTIGLTHNAWGSEPFQEKASSN